jgi:hypothetical protein
MCLFFFFFSSSHNFYRIFILILSSRIIHGVSAPCIGSSDRDEHNNQDAARAQLEFPFVWVHARGRALLPLAPAPVLLPPRDVSPDLHRVQSRAAPSNGRGRNRTIRFRAPPFPTLRNCLRTLTTKHFPASLVRSSCLTSCRRPCRRGACSRARALRPFSKSGLVFPTFLPAPSLHTRRVPCGGS